MKDNNQPPFAVGQKVVVLRNCGVTQRLIEGDIITVLDVIKTCNCSGSGWQVGYKSHPSSSDFYCGRCNSSFKAGFFFYLDAINFAPLNPPRVNAIPELLKAPVEERVDHHQPVKILTD